MKKKYRSFIFSAIFTIAILVVLLMNVKVNEIIQTIQQIPFLYILAGFVFHLLTYLFRIIVFKKFFQHEKISFFQLTHVHFVHNFYVHFVPASLGEFSFPILLKNKVNTEKSFSILVLTKLITLALTILLFFISLIEIIDLSIINYQWNSAHLLFALVILISGLIIYRVRFQLYAFFQRSKLGNKIIAKVKGFLKATKFQLKKFKHLWFTIFVIGNTLISMFSVAFFYLILLWGMQIELNLLEIFFVMSINIAFLVLPIKSIGGFGTTEGAWTIGLMICGIAKSPAIQAGFAIHIFALINVTIFFLTGAIMHFVSKNRNKQAVSEINFEKKD